MCNELLSDPQHPRIVCVGNSRVPHFDDTRALCMQSTLEALPDRKLPGDSDKPVLSDIETIFFCIGTQKKVAGKEGQIKLELDDTVAAAKAARSAGINKCAIVTCRGASANSSFTYLSTKGKVESELREIGFKHLIIARPGLITDGDRGPNSGSCKVCCMQSMLCMPTVNCDVLGRALARATLQADKPVTVLENNDILELGS
eukprot:SAG31_NODE_1486_length_8148_cov_6.234439_8_plen_202_part_00